MEIKRYLRFSLRGLLLGIVVLAVTFGVVRYAANWRDERDAALRLRFTSLLIEAPDEWAPFPLCLIGAPKVDEIHVGYLGDFNLPLSPDQEDDLEQFRKLFPEALVTGHICTVPDAAISKEWRQRLESRLPKRY